LDIYAEDCRVGDKHWLFDNLIFSSVLEITCYYGRKGRNPPPKV